MATATDVYEETVRHLPPGERLRLATLILEGIQTQPVVDYSEGWSEEDLTDWTSHSLRWLSPPRTSRKEELTPHPDCF